MTYNICEYPNAATYGDTTYRNQYFRTVLSSVNPDILAVQEMASVTQAGGFLTNVLNHFGNVYAMAGFVSNGNDNNVLFYKTSKFSSISSGLVTNALGHCTVKFKLYNINTRDTITIYNIHLASGENNSDRGVQATSIRNSTALLSSSEYFIGIGDFNTYGGSETGYTTLLNQSTYGYFIDPQGLQSEGNWSEDYLTAYNTFASRSSSFGGGTTTSGSGGLDERFDLMLVSQTVNDDGGITINTDSYTEIGNDGQHNDKSVNGSPTNTAVSPAVANALYWCSDHLPVYTDFNFGSPSTGGIAFTQVGSDNPDVIEFITLYDHMDLTKLKITNNALDAYKDFGTGGGTYDLSNTPWKDVPSGTFVRLGANLTNDNNAGDRILKYNGVGSGTIPTLGGANGDQLIAYTGSSSDPFFIAGITWANNGWQTNGGDSYAPGTPSDIALGTSSNYYFSGSVYGDADVIRAALVNPANWSSYSGGSFDDLTSSIDNEPTPVELSSFTGIFNGSYIELLWKTETEVNNYGFNIERSSSLLGTIWESIGFVEGHGNSNVPREYSFTDKGTEKSSNYYYRLKQIDIDGRYAYSGIVTVTVSVPNEISLGQNYPNPFNPETRIDFTLMEKQQVRLRVYNTLGEMVKELVNEQREAGSYTEIFNAADLPSGVYIYRLETQRFIENRKMILLK